MGLRINRPSVSRTHQMKPHLPNWRVVTPRDRAVASQEEKGNWNLEETVYRSKGCAGGRVMQLKCMQLMVRPLQLEEADFDDNLGTCQSFRPSSHTGCTKCILHMPSS